MILVFIGILFIYTNEKTKFRILVFSFISIIGFLLFWGFVSYTTDGLIVKRYNNQDAIGREKISKLSGRETLIESEWDMFLENPILGVGVGRNSEIRLEELGIRAASHNEITRLLAEHGSLGIIYLFIIIVLPFVVWYNNRQHLLLIPFFIFWILTINHAAMRMAAPAFIYSLCLLNVIINFEKKTKNENSLHRKQITS
ncbi:O-antigen ligase family protein [Flavobacterium agricola]|uniref:O-antigen ligase family protein n=1 Tax=Flavobacterium agricola TaxID=2870839 RepID=A0ABY6LVZ5_9FLAO|nr:O-antigen ligase family protein [Flavobacterium agricola]UYW00498.1 O-antigen ligase family protein [Flavobacterium agricola]